MAASAGLTACNNKVDKQSDSPPPPPPDQNGPVSSPQVATIDAKTVNDRVLKSCHGCHSGRQSPDLSTTQNVKGRISDVVSEIESNAMPPRESGLKTLSACQKAIIRSWWEAGMPETSNTEITSLPACANQGGEDHPWLLEAEE